MKLNKLALIVMTAAITTGAAHATNRDVNAFLAKIDNAAAQPQRSDLYNEAVNAFDNLNARDRMVVAGYRDMTQHSGMIADVIGSAEARGHQANVPAGWKPELTRAQIAAAHRPAHGTPGQSVRSAAVGPSSQPVATGTGNAAPVVNTINPISTAVISVNNRTDQLLKGKVDKADYAADQQKQSQRDDGQDAQIGANKANITKVNDGLIVVGDKVNDEVKNRAAEDKKLSDRIDTKADQSALDTETAERKSADNRLAVDMIKHDQAQQKLIDTNADGIAQNKADIQDRVTTSAFTADQQRQDAEVAKVSGKADRAQTTATTAAGAAQKAQQTADSNRADYTQKFSRVDTRFADTDARIAQNKADQQKVNKVMAARLDNHEARIQDLEARNAGKFADIDKRIDANRKKANAGTSTALAAAGIPQVLDSQKFALGAATGGYEGEQALAVGFSARVSSNVVVKASVGTDTQHGFGYNAGVSVGW